MSPAGMLNILAGQNAFVTAAFISFAVTFAVRKPALSGISWAVLTMKPHLGLIAIPMVLVRKQWNVILYGAIAFGILIAATITVWGLDPWKGFFTFTTYQQRFVLEDWRGLMLMLVPTAFMQGRVLNLGTQGAYMLHAVVALIATYLAIRAWPGKDWDVRDYLTWFVLSTFLILPYSFLYDLVIFQIVLALWYRQAEQLFLIRKPYADAIWMFCWILPLLSPVLLAYTFIQITPILLAFMLWQRGTAKRQGLAQQPA